MSECIYVPHNSGFRCKAAWPPFYECPTVQARSSQCHVQGECVVIAFVAAMQPADCDDAFCNSTCSRVATQGGAEASACETVCSPSARRRLESNSSIGTLAVTVSIAATSPEAVVRIESNVAAFLSTAEAASDFLDVVVIGIPEMTPPYNGSQEPLAVIIGAATGGAAAATLLALAMLLVCRRARLRFRPALRKVEPDSGQHHSSTPTPALAAS